MNSVQAAAPPAAPASAREPIIAVSGLSKRYGIQGERGTAALERVSFDIAAGEFISLVGPSGCGKTTLLRILSGLIEDFEGQALVRGLALRGPTRDIGVVFQDSNLLPWRSTLRNVLLPIEVLGLDRRKGTARARDLLQLVGLAGFENKLPQELSGGMRQRASIARALIHDPSILLLDEPFGALDAITRDAMNLELLRIWAASGKTVFLITHSISEAVLLSDRVLVMSGRPGRIVADVRIDIERPRTLDCIATPAFGRYAVELRKLLEPVAKGRA